MKVDPYFWFQKCSAESLVSGCVRFVFVLLEEGVSDEKKIWFWNGLFCIFVWISSISQELWPLLGGIAMAIRPITTGVTLVWSVCPSHWLAYPAKTVRWNEMPFGRDTHVVPSNVVLEKSPGPPMGREDLWDWIMDRNLQSKFVLQIAAKLLLVVELLL